MRTLKLLIAFLLVAFAARGAFAQSVEEKIQRALAPLESLLATDPSGKAAQDHLAEEKISNRIILQYFYAVGGPLHEYSPAREERVKEVERWLAPYEETLIGVLNASQFDGQILPSPVLVIFHYAAPTTKLRDALLAVGRNPKVTGQYAAEAYSTIFQLEMGDTNLMSEVIEKIAWRDDKNTRAELGMNLLVTASTRWARPELKEMYQEFLSVPYKPENYPSRGGKVRLRTYYKLALAGLKPFGKLDDSLVSLMKARLSEMTPKEDRDLYGSFKDSIMIAEGEAPPVPVTNFKGHLLGVSKDTYPAWLAMHPKRSSPEQGSSQKRPRNQTTDTNDAQANEHFGSLDTEPSTKRIYIKVSFVLIVGFIIITLMWYRLKKRAQ